MSCFIIAEIGVNHDGDLSKAVALTRAAAAAGVDAVKFQYFHAIYQARGDNSILKMLQPLELSFGQLTHLAVLCAELGVEFLCTPFDRTAAENTKTLGVKRMKIGSGQVKDLGFLKLVGQLGLPMILSNGMCTDDDLDKALKVSPDDVTLLSCVSMYPTPFDAIHFDDMDRLRKKFGKKVGYSCHAGSPWPTIIAAARGADVVEAHITLSRCAPGPDHSSSLEVGELAHWVKQIRAVSA